MAIYKTTAEELADKGKAEERKVQAYLKELQERYFSFTFMRLPDARSSMGRGAVKRVSDFIFQTPGIHGCLEVKALGHPNLLPNKNLSQIAMMRRYQGSGHIFCVMIYHVVSDKPKDCYWRVPDFDWLVSGRHNPSWDLESFIRFKNHKEALDAFLKAKGAKLY